MGQDKVRHDFINNGIRIEVLNQLITGALEEQKKINSEHINDLERFLKEQVKLLKQLKELQPL